MDVHFGNLAAGQTYAGDRVNLLGNFERGETIGGGVAEARNGEGAWEFGQATEGGAGVGSFARVGIEGVVDCEGALSAERKGETFANAKICAFFQGGGSRRVVNADLHTRATGRGFETTASGVANLADGD